LAGRAADDLQHLRRRGLLLQCLGKIVRALAQFIEQPRVLNGDDGLGSKGPEKRNLFLCERLNFTTSNLDCSDRDSLTQQRNTSRRPVSQPPRDGASFGKVLGLRLEVNYMNGAPLENGAARNTSMRAGKTEADL